MISQKHYTGKTAVECQPVMYGRPCARENKRGVAIRVTHRGTCVTAEAVPSARGPTATRTSLRAEIRAAPANGPSRSDRRSKSHFGRRCCLVPGDTRLCCELSWTPSRLGSRVGPTAAIRCFQYPSVYCVLWQSSDAGKQASRASNGDIFLVRKGLRCVDLVGNYFAGFSLFWDRLRSALAIYSLSA
jgi:hypothetical protein